MEFIFDRVCIKMNQDDLAKTDLNELINDAVNGGNNDLLKAWLWNFAGHILRGRAPDNTEREQLVSEIYYTKLSQSSFWRYLQSKGSEAGLHGYVATTVIRAFLDVKRKDQRLNARETVADPDDFIFQANSVLEGTADEEPYAELFDLVQGCLERMPAEDRELVVRRYGFDGPTQTWPEIAAALALPEETVKKRGQRQLSKLKACVQENGKMNKQ